MQTINTGVVRRQHNHTRTPASHATCLWFCGSLRQRRVTSGVVVGGRDGLQNTVVLASLHTVAVGVVAPTHTHAQATSMHAISNDVQGLLDPACCRLVEQMLYSGRNTNTIHTAKSSKLHSTILHSLHSLHCLLWNCTGVHAMHKLLLYINHCQCHQGRRQPNMACMP